MVMKAYFLPAFYVPLRDHKSGGLSDADESANAHGTWRHPAGSFIRGKGDRTLRVERDQRTQAPRRRNLGVTDIKTVMLLQTRIQIKRQSG